MGVERGRRTVALRRTGGSSAVVLPKAWLRAMGVQDHVDLVRTETGIAIEPPERQIPSIEDEPEFERFLTFIAKDALAHPEELGDVGELTDGDEALFAGVGPDE